MRIISSLFVLLIFTGGISFSDEKAVKDIPSFYVTPPQSKTIIYGLGTAKFSSPSLSIDMAKARATEDLDRQINIIIDSYKPYMLEYANDPDSPTEKYFFKLKREYSQLLRNYRKINQIYMSDNDTAFALVELQIEKLVILTEEIIKNNEVSEYKYNPLDKILEDLKILLK